MKYAILTLLLLMAIRSFAQAPQGIPYQAVARSSSGAIIANHSMGLRFTIRDSIAMGTIVYQETFSTTTNNLGLFNVNVGLGSAVVGTFSSINWGHNPKFMQVEMDVTGGTSYVDMGTQQMMSVPYALHAGNAHTYIAGDGITINGDTILNSLYPSNSFDSTKPKFNLGFSNSTAWICPEGVTKIIVQVWGGSGGGGSGAMAYSGLGYYLGCISGYALIGGNGGWGGNGGYSKQILTVTPGIIYSITIGIGGSGGAIGGHDGTSGGSSNFNGIVYANGGTGGATGYSGYPNACSDGTSGSNGDIINFTPPSFFSLLPANPRSFIPGTYITTAVLPGNCAVGGQGGQGGFVMAGGAIATDYGKIGGAGESGYCIISY